MVQEIYSMKNDGKYARWILCLLLSSAWACATETDATSASARAVALKDTTGLERLGIGEGYEIVVADDRDIVENTAAEMLQQFLKKAGLAAPIVSESEATGKKRFLLGRDSNLNALRELGDQGTLDIRSISSAEDGFHLKQLGEDIAIAGANPRAVLYGVFAFEDYIRAGTEEPLDIRSIPAISSRIQLMPTFLVSDHPAAYRDATEKTAAYLARLGVNGCIDGGGGSWELTRFVSSDVFPFQKAPDPEMQHNIASKSSVFKKYGIDYYIMLWEPSIAQVNAEIDQYPPEALGTVKRPWGGDEKGMDTTLCVTSPLVQDHYRNLTAKFVREYPDVKGFLFYNLDGSSWLCTPELCPRCQAVCTDSPPNTPHPWETQALFTDLLAKTAREARGDFEFIHWISHFHGDAAEKLVRTSQEYSALAYGVQNGDHDVMIADPVTPDSSEFGMLKAICAERSLPFFTIFSSNSHEVIPNGFQFPFHVGQAMQKLHGWGVRNISGCGPIPYFNQINALAEKEFQWNPAQDPETFLAELSVRQFGSEAGDLMYQAWEEVRDGMDVFRDMALHPFCGSQMHQSIGFSYVTRAPALLPDIADYYNNSLVILTNVEPFRAPQYQKFREKEYLDRFRKLATHMKEAASLASEAIQKADANEPIGIDYYNDESIPTMKEYAELNYAPLAIAETYTRLRCNMIGAYHLIEGMKADNAAGNHEAAQEKKAQYHDLLREDIAVRERFVGILTEFAKMQPCLTRTSLSEEGIAYQITYMNTEIEKTNDFLSQDNASESGGQS